MTTPLSAGTKLGRYEIRSQLGAGGMGEVYLAQDTKLDRKVAIKFLTESLVADEQARKRLEREARSAAKLDNPNICSIYEVGEEDGRSFIVMQYIEGETLDVRIKRKPLDLLETLSIAIQVADALAEAHAHAIIHRDIKPSNVIITHRGQAKVMDFGLARSIGEAVENEAETILTAPGMILGTLPYMSPEQVRGEQTDARTDVFSFGTMLYEFASGRQPFASESAAATASAILTHEPPPLARFAPEVPDELQRIVRKCLEKDREQRYQSARDLAIDLENIRRQHESAGVQLLSADRSPAVSGGPGVFAAAKRAMPLLSRRVVVTAALVALVGAGLVYLMLFHRAPVASALPIKSLAVLPLENLSGDPAQEYFADGMTEALTTELAKIGALRVISRTSAMQYKGVRKSLPAIGRELNVEGVVEGSVQRSGGRVKITVQLISAGMDQHLWAGSYDRDLTDILVLQSDVARDIAKEVRIQVTAPETARLSSSAKVNPEAHDAYLRGRFYWNKDAREDLERAREYFEQALDKDPRYAPAYAGLADYYSVLPFYTNARPDDVFPKAKQAVAKALELDSSLAEAHGTQAYILTYYDRDWAAAQREFQEALALNPNDATLHHRYSRYLSSLGRVEEALGEIERARLLDPNDLVIKANVGVIYYFARQYDRTIEELQKVLRDHPDFSNAHWGLGLAYEQKGNYDLALPEFQKAAERRSPNALASLGHIYGLIGREKEAKEILSELSARAGQENISEYQLAVVHIGLGETAAAMEALQRAYQEHSTVLNYMKMDPRLGPLRGDPRFQDLLRRMNFPQ
jgi:TolB-like protein/tetratricopeptide (TPR) repeat protein/predicted Ser/Thr protein kinase